MKYQNLLKLHKSGNLICQSHISKMLLDRETKNSDERLKNLGLQDKEIQMRPVPRSMSIISLIACRKCFEGLHFLHIEM